MKNFRKLLAVVLSLTILLTFAAPVMVASAPLTDAEKCEMLGVLKGAGYGVTQQYLSTATTRAQGATLLLRLMGKEDEAKAYEGQDNFTDIVGNEWFAPLLAYLKANPDLGFGGYPDGTFQPDKIMTVAEFYKVLLTVLGYEQNVDYTWAEVMDFAEDEGLGAFENGAKSLINNDIAISIIEALKIHKKNAGQTLTEFLIGEGVISATVADSLDLTTGLRIINAGATNDDEITVAFNNSVPEGTSVTVKNGYVSIYTTKTWNDQRTQVVLKKVTPFLSATYQIEVEDMAPVDVVVKAGEATQIGIESRSILKDEEASFDVILYNQYGKEMKFITRSDFSITAFNKTQGGTLYVDPSSFSINTSKCEEGDKITVTVMHNESTLVGQFDLNIILKPTVSQFNMTGIEIPDNQNKIETGDSNVVINYIAYDQYGSALELTSKEGLTFVSSNESILDPNSVNFDSDGVMTVDFEDVPGTVNLSVLVNSSASVESLPIDVYDPSNVDSVQIYSSTGMVISGESVKIVYSALDQFGSPVSKSENDSEIDSKIKFVSTDKSIVNNSDFNIDSSGELTVTPTGGDAGSVVIYYYWEEELIDTFTLDVNEPAVPAAVAGINYTEGIELNATQDIPLNQISVIDQYGREYDVDEHGMTSSQFLVESDNSLVTCSAGTNKLSFEAGDTEGEVVFTIGINDGGEFLANSAQTFSMEVYDVDSSDVDLEFASFPVLYSDPSFTTATGAGDYAKLVEVIGKAADGTLISLKQNKISHLTSDNTNIVVYQNGNTFKLFAKGDSEESAVIRAYDGNGGLLCDMEVTTSTQRTIRSISFGDDVTLPLSAINNHDIADVSQLNFKVLDEYGVNMLNTGSQPKPISLNSNGFFTSSDSGVLSVDPNDADGYITANVGAGKTETVTLKYTTVTGMQDSINITITN